MVEKYRESTALSREIGAELRKAREAAGHMGYGLARNLGWSQSKVSRMESGMSPPSEVDAAMYLAYCKVDPKEINRLLDLTREANTGYRLRAHGEALPDELRSLIVQETTADLITDFEVAQVPGLLQTEDYCRALLGALGLRARDIEPRVQARLDRQSLLRRQKPLITFLIHEHALRAPVGGYRVMHEQCLHLLFEAQRIRVVPAEIGAHPGMSGAFRIMEFFGHNPVVYVENRTVSLFLEKVADVATYRGTAHKLADVALDEGQSRTLIARLASEYDRPEGTPP